MDQSHSIAFEGYVWIRKGKDDLVPSTVYDESYFKKKKKRWVIVTDSEFLYKHSPTSADSKSIDLVKLFPLIGLDENDRTYMVYMMDTIERQIIVALEPCDYLHTSELSSCINAACVSKRRQLMINGIIHDDKYLLSDTLYHCRDTRKVLCDIDFSEHGSAVHFAVHHKSSSCFSFLLNTLGCDCLHIQNHDGAAPIHIAVQRPDCITFFKDFLQISSCKGISKSEVVSMRDAVGRTPLHVCSDEELIAIILQHGANVEAQDVFGNTPLMLACDRGDFLAVVELLDHAAIVNKASWSTGQTPLMNACQPGYDEVFDELMHRGADVGALDNNKCSALHYACMNGFVLGCVQLLNMGVDPDLQDCYGATAICYACGVTALTQATAREIVALLLARGSYPRIRDYGGRQALHYAAESGNSSAIPVLLSSGSDINAVDHSGATAMEIVDNKLALLAFGNFRDCQESTSSLAVSTGKGAAAEGDGGGDGEQDRVAVTSDSERHSLSQRLSGETMDNATLEMFHPEIQELLTFAAQLRRQGLRVTEKNVDTERWKSRYMECQSILLANGAVKRAIKTVPVEQDCRDITFSYAKNGSYSVATATPWALVTRITTFPYFTALHASNLLATYRLYLSPLLLLKLLQLRFYSLHNMHTEAVDMILQDPVLFSSAGVFLIEEKQVVYRLKMLANVHTTPSTNADTANGSSLSVLETSGSGGRPDSSGKNRLVSRAVSAANVQAEGPMQYVKGIDSHVIMEYTDQRTHGDVSGGSPGKEDNEMPNTTLPRVHDRVTFRSVYIGKIAAMDSNMGSNLIERLMKVINATTSGVELFHDCLMLLVRRRYVRIDNLCAYQEFNNDGMWSLRLYDGKYQPDSSVTTETSQSACDSECKGDISTHFPAFTAEAFSLSSLELTCKPGHRLMRGKVVVELRAVFINTGRSTPLTSNTYLMDHCRDDLCEVFATILLSFVQGSSNRVQLVPPTERYKLISPTKLQSSNDIDTGRRRSHTPGYAKLLRDEDDKPAILRSNSDLCRSDRRALHSLESEIKHHESLPSVFHGMKIMERKASTEIAEAHCSAISSPASSRKGITSARQSEASEYSNRSSGSTPSSVIGGSPHRVLTSERNSDVSRNVEVNVASLRGCMQLLSTWCTDFFEDDFERDTELRHKTGAFLTEVMEKNGDLIEDEFDPSAFTPFLNYEGVDEDVLTDLPLGNKDVTSRCSAISNSTESTEPTRDELVRRSVVVRRATEGPQQRASIFSRRMSQKAHTPLKKRGTTLMNVFTSVYDTYDESCIDESNFSTTPVFSILSLTPIDVAEQLTLLEHDLFCRIKRSELIDSKQSTYHNLKKLQAFSVHAMDFMISQVVASDSMEEVAEKITFLLSVSQHMRKIRNYNGMFEILTVLETTSVYRLKSAWAKLDAASVAEHASLKALFSSRAGFQAFRKFLTESNCQPPCMPYMGLYLKDIIYILQLPSYVSPGIVNVTKMGSLACKVVEIHSYQGTPYHFLSQPDTIAVLKSQPQFCTEDEQYEASIKLEPIAGRCNGNALG